MTAMTMPAGWRAVVVLTAALIAIPMPAGADDAMDARQLVERARLSFESAIVAPEMDPLRDLIQRARGVFIAPQILRAAFIVGMAGGSGLLVARGEGGEWGGPAFYTIGELSVGAQAGGDASEVFLLAMTERGVSAMLGTSVRLGGDISAAVGPVGVGVRMATANLSVDIVSFSRAKGLYGGMSVDGSVVATRGALNAAHFGQPVTPADILIRRTVSNPLSASLIELIRKAAEPK